MFNAQHRPGAMAQFNEAAQSWLAAFLSEAGAVAGTVHFHQKGGLVLAASQKHSPEWRCVLGSLPKHSRESTGDCGVGTLGERNGRSRAGARGACSDL